jgi:hypothetical protein
MANHIILKYIHISEFNTDKNNVTEIIKYRKEI